MAAAPAAPKMGARRVTLDDVQRRERDSDRDMHTQNTRVAAFHAREERRAAPLEKIKAGEQSRQISWGLHLVVGAKGSGKSLYTVTRAAEKWTEQGRPIFTTDALGLEFGYVVTAFDLYLALQRAPRDAIIIADEAHQILNSSGGSATRIQLIIQSIAGLRKMNQELWLPTSQYNRLHPAVLSEVDVVHAPQNTYRAAKAVNRYGERVHPPWSYMMIKKVEPRPFRQKGGGPLLEEYGIRTDGKKPQVTRLRPPPSLIWECSKGYDSFAPLLSYQDSGQGISAKDIRAGLAEDDGGVWYDWTADVVDAEESAVTDLTSEIDQQRATAFLLALRAHFVRRRYHIKPRTAYEIGYLVIEANQYLTDPMVAGAWSSYEGICAEAGIPPDGAFRLDEARLWITAATGVTGKTLSSIRYNEVHATEAQWIDPASGKLRPDIWIATTGHPEHADDPRWYDVYGVMKDRP